MNNSKIKMSTTEKSKNTKKKRKTLKEKYRKLFGPDTGVHEVWHKFTKKFYKYKKVKVTKEERKRWPVLFGKRKYQTYRDGWKYTGYKLMRAVRKFAEKYPKNVEVLSIDDSAHASSDMVFIHHIRKYGKDKGKNWGTTVVVITQCDGQPPCEFFMYPGHQKQILKSLQNISKINER